MATSPWFWVLFNAFILAMLALDLGVFHRRSHSVGMREAAVWSAGWVALALAFGAGIHRYAGSGPAIEFVAGYVIEKSLAVDNLFVFAVIFSYFAVPDRLQYRVLYYGVVGALLMRGTFITLGALALHEWHWVLYIFGGLLVLTGIKFAVRAEEIIEPERNPVVRLVHRWLPFTQTWEGDRFWVRRDGRLLATPLFLVLVVVEITDLVFAVDSIPAIFAVTRDPFLVYTSNVFAILGLRAMYFLLARVVQRFIYLRYGLAVVLVFVGLKMLFDRVIDVPTLLSLIVVAVVITASIVLSLLRPPVDAAAQVSANRSR